MKRLLLLGTLILLLLAALVGSVPTSYAQTTATEIEFLSVEFWPDYDQPSVLVLLTGTLPSTALLPAEVTIPLPPEARLNAVARITADNMMIDDIEFTEVGDSVIFATPDSRFRIEYYVPYAVDSDDHVYTFEWLADVAVAQLAPTVQQPLAASSLSTDPAALSVSGDREDGFRYHNLPLAMVPAGESYRLSFRYPMPEPQLSVSIANQNPGGATGGGDTAVSGSNILQEQWPYFLAIAGVVLVVGATVWYLLRQGSSNRVRKPRPRRANPSRSASQASSAAAKYCHNCGQPSEAGDKFCRSCGTQLKGT